MYILKRLRKLIQTHRRRDIIARKTEFVFGKDSEAYQKIMKACDASRDTLRGKKRKNGEPVIFHERAMYVIALLYLSITDVNLLVAIFLHDMHEDYPKEWPLSRIKREYGLEVMLIVQAVSKPQREAGVDNLYYSSIIFAQVMEAGVKAQILKIIDRLHNMLTLYGAQGKMTFKVRQTYMFVIPMAIEIDVLAEELVLATDEQYKRLRRKGIKVFG